MFTTSQPNEIVPPPLLGKSLEDLKIWAKEYGQPAYRGKQLHDSIYHQGIRSILDIPVFPKKWRLQVSGFSIGRSHLYHRSVATDGTVKYLLQLQDGQIIETVGIPTFKCKQKKLSYNLLVRLTVCVSTQVGCPMACDFCATGKGGYKRNLELHEIIDQVLTVQEDFQQRVSNVVFMGMGEPLLNTDNVLRAIYCLNKDIGIGQRNLTLSTVGIPGRICQLSQYLLQVTLAVSLHAPNQSLREKLIPSAHRYQIGDLLDECREYVKITGRRVSFEYILISGFNDLPEHAVELAKCLRGFQNHVNLIPYNPISEVHYQRPSNDNIQAFGRILKKQDTNFSIRYSRGLETDAACGQLRVSKRNNN